MRGAAAIAWCKARGVNFEIANGNLVIVGVSRLNEKQINRIREIKPDIIAELTLGQRKEEIGAPPATPKTMLCETCGEVATHGIGAYPWRGIEGVWFCASHVPKREKIEAAIVQDNIAAPSEPKHRGRFLKIRNIVTGVETVIDLHAKQKRVRVAGNPAPQREQIIINAERVSQNDPISQIDYQLLQDVADVRNQYAEQDQSTDRFCRCGNLAETQWRLEGNLVWMCNECFRGE